MNQSRSETPKLPVDLSRYSKEEREIIDIVQSGRDRPLTQEEINLSLHQAWMIGHLVVEPEIVPVTFDGENSRQSTLQTSEAVGNHHRWGKTLR